MVSVRMLDAIYLRQLEFGVDEVGECFVMPRVVGDSGDKWMVLVSLLGGVTFNQLQGRCLGISVSRWGGYASSCYDILCEHLWESVALDVY